MATSYQARVDLVMDHVRRHLDEDLPLADLAAVANFSPFHFHRIFRASTGETVADFVRRARLERAVQLMQTAPQRPLTSIAAETGFATPSDFARVFRRQYGRTPSSWDRRSRLDAQPDLTDNAAQLAPGFVPCARIVRRPALRIFYHRVRNPWQGNTLATGFRALTEHLDAAGDDWRARRLVGLSWESAKATDVANLVYDLGFVFDAASPPPPSILNHDGEQPFGWHRFDSTDAVEVRCPSLPAVAVTWEHLYTEWLPSSPYEPNDQPAMKRFHRLPTTFTPDDWLVDCSIGLRPRRP
ncbi:MAG: AraC family transcriptional regulator [Actinomycetota bacterium]